MATERKKQQDRERMQRKRSEQAARILELENQISGLMDLFERDINSRMHTEAKSIISGMPTRFSDR